MKTILVPIDFSTVSAAVLKAGAALTLALKGRLVLLHVIPPPVITGEYGAVMPDFAATMGAIEKATTTQLIRHQRKLRARGVASTVVQVIGAPTSEILTQAKRLKAAYIVMGSHGHSALYDLLAGSTATGVLRKSPCPVLIVPPPEAKARRTKK